MSAILEVKRLRKAFGGVVAVDDNNFTVERGTRLGIIGPNGAGKTTTFNMIAGFFKPTAGTIEFEGHRISGLSPHRISQLGIGRTFQNVRAFRELTVYDHVMAGAIAHEMHYKPTAGTIEFEGHRISGLSPHRISQLGIGRTFQNVRAFRELTVYDHVMAGAIAHEMHYKPTAKQVEEVERILKWAHLSEHRDIQVKNLTLAAQRQIELATALATKPKLLLLDELMAGLTFVEIDLMLDLLRMVNQEMGITLIVVEHVMKVIMTLCHRILVLSYGKIIAEGNPKEISTNKTVIEAYLGEEKTHA